MQRKVLLATVLAALVAAALTVRSRPFSLGQERIPAPAFPAPGRRTSERLFGCRFLRLAGLPRRS